MHGTFLKLCEDPSSDGPLWPVAAPCCCLLQQSALWAYDLIADAYYPSLKASTVRAFSILIWLEPQQASPCSPLLQLPVFGIVQQLFRFQSVTLLFSCVSSNLWILGRFPVQRRLSAGWRDGLKAKPVLLCVLLAGQVTDTVFVNTMCLCEKYSCCHCKRPWGPDPDSTPFSLTVNPPTNKARPTFGEVSQQPSAWNSKAFCSFYGGGQPWPFLIIRIWTLHCHHFSCLNVQQQQVGRHLWASVRCLQHPSLM